MFQIRFQGIRGEPGFPGLQGLSGPRGKLFRVTLAKVLYSTPIETYSRFDRTKG